MTDQQKEFLFQAVIEQESYDTISLKTGIDRGNFTKWWEELKEEREELSAIRQLWRSKLGDPAAVQDTFDSFHKWFLTTERKCHYCGISEEQIDQLWQKDPMLTKRKRGKALEIDRKKPNNSYEDIQNLVLSCYWCNNAKTDTFSEEEFLEIGKAIREVWEKRLRL